MIFSFEILYSKSDRNSIFENISAQFTDDAQQKSIGKLLVTAFLLMDIKNRIQSPQWLWGLDVFCWEYTEKNLLGIFKLLLWMFLEPMRDLPTGACNLIRVPSMFSLASLPLTGSKASILLKERYHWLGWFQPKRHTSFLSALLPTFFSKFYLPT